MLKKPFLLYPLILLAAIFIFDKIFLLEKVKSYIKSDFTYIYYETRNELLNSIQTRDKNKKLMVILGSSRLLYFDSASLEEFYPDWEIYNFSSAVTTPAYYYYYLIKILELGIKPDLVLLETDPNQFNANTPIFKNSNLTYSFDLPFVLKHAAIFGKDNVFFYIGKWLFAAGKNKPNLDVAWKRINDPTFKALGFMAEQTRTHLLKSKGHSLNPIAGYFEKDFTHLNATSQRTLDWLYTGYRLSPTQAEFFSMILKRVHDEKIPLLIVWPQSSIPMQRMIKSAPFLKEWKDFVEPEVLKYNYKIKNMDDANGYYCNAFVDGGHIAVDCYHPFMRYVMEEYYKEFKQK